MVNMNDLFKEDIENILADLVLLIMIISMTMAVDSLVGNATINLFDITYSLDILSFYLFGFIFVLTTNSLFKDIRAFLNIMSTYVIKKFPRMQGNFNPLKSVLRDFVQIMMLMLIFYPVSQLIQALSISQTYISYTVSLIFLVLTLVFVYDIVKNIVKMASLQLEKMSKGVQFNLIEFDLEANEM